ncbi:McrC family protein [Vibrio sp. RE86]|uniref:McrC family protein n=1 Tax=Vibrio sp. RE86 TaxID=2607605 RepID=UPI0020A3A25D|nr:McrC family protein [Vibrio sp. RE86]
MEVLQVQNYAGVIFTPDKTQIEVLPKIGKGFNGECNESDCVRARQTLLTMLRALKGFSHIQTSNANIDRQRMPLFEVFIGQFLQSVNTLVKRGLRSDYVCREDNLGFLKGKLNVGKQVRHNFVNKHKFYCEYDEFLLDHPVNRLIHSALRKVKNYTRSAANQKLLQELEFVFHEVPESRDYKVDFSKVKLVRGMGYYQVPLDWCLLILEGFSPQTMKGNQNAFSLLFPMERVFEDYVAKTLGEQLCTDHQLRTQVKAESLVEHNDQNWFRLKPDLVIELRQNSVAACVLDTKWKLLDSSKCNGSDKYGLSQADFYQMFAYGHKYLDGDGELFLIYPAHDGFNKSIQYSFDFDSKLKLWVVPFEVGLDTESKVIWPEEPDSIVNQRSLFLRRVRQ